MGAPYSQDLRDRVLAACDRGMTTKMVADIFSVSTALKKLGFTYKKRRSTRRNRSARTSPSDAINCYRHCGYTLRVE